jgi:phosphatidylglycerophosphate synthase
VIPRRVNRGLLAEPEGRILDVAMALTSWLSLLLVVLGFTLNWLGDSLDGRLARHRRIERKAQGFILDNGVDLIAYLLLALGFAISGLVSLPVPFLLLSLYMLLSNLALARLVITGEHDLAIDSVGTTELRVAFLVLAAMLFAWPAVFRALIPLLEISMLDFLSLFWACIMLLNFILVLRRDIRLARKADEG